MTDAETERADAVADTAPEVDTATGRVRGFWRGEPGAAGSSAAFLGIPFAQPPVGELRFAAPVPPEPWQGVREAREYGATAYRGDDGGKTLIPEPSYPGDATLNVNVFTPDPRADALLPAMVYIHGGGYVSGTPASPWYDGAAFCRDGIVTVSISYRLGFDGFGWIDGAPSNRGVRDWLLALEWVQRNIAAFGGDPDEVTIAGQSAGGGAVLTLLGMPAAQHLFRRVWAISGALGDVDATRAEGIARRLAKAAGVAPTRDGFTSVPEATLTAMQDAAVTPASRNPLAGAEAILGTGLPYGPMVDGDLLTQPTTASLAAGVGADKPLVLGTTDDEFTMVLASRTKQLRWVPVGLALGLLRVPGRVGRAYLAANRDIRSRGTAALLGRYVTDTVFRTDVVRIARARARARARAAAAPTWVYRFAWISPTYHLAMHCLDVPFFFDCLGSERVGAIAGDAPPQTLADQVHGSAVAFVRTGDTDWTPWSEHPGTARVFDGAPGVTVQPDAYASVEPLV